MYTVGSGTITEGVDDLIIGMKAGEELKVNGNVGAGIVATYELTLKKVQERELPELSDEWVQDNTDWQSEEEMRDAIFDQMRRRRIMEAQMSQREAVLMALSDLVSDCLLYTSVPRTMDNCAFPARHGSRQLLISTDSRRHSSSDLSPWGCISRCYVFAVDVSSSRCV